jgi:molecular chaperone DnaK (HSP70)
MTFPAAWLWPPALPPQDAAAVADLPAQGLTSDGGAAALAWLLKRGGRCEEPERRVLFLDLGGGGLSVSLSKSGKGTVKASTLRS